MNSTLPRVSSSHRAPTSYGRESGLSNAAAHNSALSLTDLSTGIQKCIGTFCSFLYSYLPGIINPADSVFQWWNQFLALSCLVSIFMDPLFFFVFSVRQDDMCMVMNRTMATNIVVFRSITDAIYFLHIFLQFRLAYVAQESRMMRSGDLADNPMDIAIHYLTGYFFIDLFVVLPLPQITVLCAPPNYLSSSGANYAKNSLHAAVLVQYMSRLYRFSSLLVAHSSIGFIFESAWTNFVVNLLTFLLVGHVVGSSWYLFGLQRVNQCLQDLCNHADLCKYVDCGYGNVHFNHSASDWIHWNDSATNACLAITDNGFEALKDPVVCDVGYNLLQLEFGFGEGSISISI